MNVRITKAEALAILQAAGNIMDTETEETQVEFFGSKTTYNAAWRCYGKLKLVVQREK